VRPSTSIFGQRHAAKHHQRVEQLVDGRLAQLGKRGVRGTAVGLQPDAQRAARRRAEPVVGRLAVHEEAHARGRLPVGRAGAVAAAFLAHHEQQPEPSFAGGAQTFGGRNLCREDALGVAGAAAEYETALLAARMNGGTQSKCVENTTSGVSPRCA
jgi:hypothetical protein